MHGRQRTVAHVPWTASDISTFCNTFPKLRESPTEFRDKLQQVFNIYNPTVSDVNWLLNSLLNPKQKRLLITETRNVHGGTPWPEND